MSCAAAVRQGDRSSTWRASSASATAACELGVSHGSVYRHLPSKATLRDAVAERWLPGISAPLAEAAAEEGPAPERLRRWLDMLVESKRGRALLTNDGEKEADLQLLRVEGEHSPAEVIEAAGGAIRGKPFPDWFFAGGGVGLTPGGQSQTITQVLEPGTYYALNTRADGPPDPKTVAAIEVGGAATEDELPGTDATVTSIDYGFETDGDFKVGENEITFENTGEQPHHIVAELIANGKTIEDARGFLENYTGKSPFDETVLDQTTALDAGGSQVVTLNLKQPGKYALLCFVSDRQGGPPHSIGEGMLGEIEVR